MENLAYGSSIVYKLNKDITLNLRILERDPANDKIFAEIITIELNRTSTKAKAKANVKKRKR